LKNNLLLTYRGRKAVLTTLLLRKILLPPQKPSSKTVFFNPLCQKNSPFTYRGEIEVLGTHVNKYFYFPLYLLGILKEQNRKDF
jgi:hypothetical protein